jgi:hypothetical protein
MTQCILLLGLLVSHSPVSWRQRPAGSEVESEFGLLLIICLRISCSDAMDKHVSGKTLQHMSCGL